MSAASGDKDELRLSFKAARRAMSDEARSQARAAVRAIVVERAANAGWRCVAAYVPLRTEPGSVELLDGLAGLDLRVIVPVTLPDHDLDWTQWGSPDVLLGRDAIGTADAVLVPALAVAAVDGTRLGRGGGSYDRALVRCHGPATVAALLFDGEVVPSLPREPWDVPVSSVVTASGWTTVGNTGIGPVS